MSPSFCFFPSPSVFCFPFIFLLPHNLLYCSFHRFLFALLSLLSIRSERHCISSFILFSFPLFFLLSLSFLVFFFVLLLQYSLQSSLSHSHFLFALQLWLFTISSLSYYIVAFYLFIHVSIFFIHSFLLYSVFVLFLSFHLYWFGALYSAAPLFFFHNSTYSLILHSVVFICHSFPSFLCVTLLFFLIMFFFYVGLISFCSMSFYFLVFWSAFILLYY